MPFHPPTQPASIVGKRATEAAAVTENPVIKSKLMILAPTQYPWRFNSPRVSHHTVIRRKFLPLNYLSPSLEGITFFPPFPVPDLIHAFNRIPVSRRPFVIGFESHLPRGFGIEHTSFFKWMTRMILDDRCRGIVAISDFARRMFLHQHAGHPRLEMLRRKLFVRLPSVVMPGAPDLSVRGSLTPLRLLFVGNHFARKGGCVALRMAERALAQDIPLNIEIVSNIEVGAVSWTDPSDPSFFDRYRPLLSLPNVRLHGALPNNEVLERIRSAHFLMLPTFGDTFGYSAIEGLMQGTPVIATAQCALPEFIRDGSNGYLLNLPLTEKGEWELLGHPDRGSRAFTSAHAEAVDNLAEQALVRLEGLLARPGQHKDMIQEAYDSAGRYFGSAWADIFWDGVYGRAEQRVLDVKRDLDLISPSAA